MRQLAWTLCKCSHVYLNKFLYSISANRIAVKPSSNKKNVRNMLSLLRTLYSFLRVILAVAIFQPTTSLLLAHTAKAITLIFYYPKGCHFKNSQVMRIDVTDAPPAHANAGNHRDDVRTPPLSPSAAASDAASSSAGGSQFWCHECDANVATHVDEATDEVCCQRCGGNFVEEVEAVRCYKQLCVLLLLASLSVCTTHSCYCNCVCLRRMIHQKCSAATWQNQQQVLRQLPCRL